MQLSENLIQRLAQDDNRAYLELYKFYTETARLVCRDVREKEDLIQETMISARNASPKYDPSLSSPSTYLIMLMRRKARDLFRKSKARIKLDSKDYESAGGLEVDLVEREEETTRKIAKIAQSIPEAYKETFDLFYIRGLSIGQIKTVTNVPEGTIKCRLNRSRARIIQRAGT